MYRYTTYLARSAPCSSIVTSAFNFVFNIIWSQVSSCNIMQVIITLLNTLKQTKMQNLQNCQISLQVKFLTKAQHSVLSHAQRVAIIKYYKKKMTNSHFLH
jgi:hypothetical protein